MHSMLWTGRHEGWAGPEPGAAREEIKSFWLRREHRESPSWAEHRAINDVRLATCLVPDGFLMRLPVRCLETRLQRCTATVTRPTVILLSRVRQTREAR